MPKKNKEGLQKHTLFLFEGDMEELRVLCPNLPAAAVVRTLVRSFIIKTRAGESTQTLRMEIEL